MCSDAAASSYTDADSSLELDAFILAESLLRRSMAHPLGAHTKAPICSESISVRLLQQI